MYDLLGIIHNNQDVTICGLRYSKMYEQSELYCKQQVATKVNIEMNAVNNILILSADGYYESKYFS